MVTSGIPSTGHEKFTTPILFIIFNRPAVTRKVFDQIRNVKPNRLFIAADGPRFPLKNEYALCEQTRSIIDLVDWPCEVKTFFQESNNGCGRGVSAAINWFFGQVEDGIILEDDCLPSADFFIFCSRLLELYRYDDSVITICGSTLLGGKFTKFPGHYLGNSNGVWGWATWKRAWNLYDYEMKSFSDPAVLERIRSFLGRDIFFEHVVDTCKLLVNRKIDTWDIQWYFAGLRNQMKAACPFQNMISNIGYEGAHDFEVTRLHNRKILPVDLARVQERCVDEALVREAELYPLKFHGVYPRFLFAWKIKKAIFNGYVCLVTALLGERPLRLEGYASAVRWHAKRALRSMKKKFYKKL